MKIIVDDFSKDLADLKKRLEFTQEETKQELNRLQVHSRISGNSWQL